MEDKKVNATELTDEQVQSAVGGLNCINESINFVCPQCGAKMSDPYSCKACGWKKQQSNSNMVNML